MLLIFQKKRIHFIKKVEEKDLSKEKDFDFFENLQRKEMKRKGFRPTLKHQNKNVLVITMIDLLMLIRLPNQETLPSLVHFSLS